MRVSQINVSSCQDNTNTALAPLTNALSQIVTSYSQVDFATVGFSVSRVEVVLQLLIPAASLLTC